jgi:hypothetical protein
VTGWLRGPSNSGWWVCMPYLQHVLRMKAIGYVVISTVDIEKEQSYSAQQLLIRSTPNSRNGKQEWAYCECLKLDDR